MGLEREWLLEAEKLIDILETRDWLVIRRLCCISWLRVDILYLVKPKDVNR